MSRIKIDDRKGYEILGISGEPDVTGGKLSEFVLVDDYMLEYEYVPGPGYADDPREHVMYQHIISTKEERHCGMTPECCWTEWISLEEG